MPWSDSDLARALAELREDDIPALAKAACHEADTNYPVPRVMSRADCEAMLRMVLPAPRTAAAAPAKPMARKAATRKAAAPKRTAARKRGS